MMSRDNKVTVYLRGRKEPVVYRITEINKEVLEEIVSSQMNDDWMTLPGPAHFRGIDISGVVVEEWNP